MSFKKKYIEKGMMCMVTFCVTKESVGYAETVDIMCESGNWKKEEMTMTRKANGAFSVTVNLRSGEEYQFRYLIDGKQLINDWFADAYLKNTLEDYSSSILVV